MAQQVCRAKVVLPSLVNGTDNVSIDFIVEATGSDTSLDFATAQTPQNAIENFFLSTLGTHPIGAYISQDIDRTANACSIQWTDITAHLDGSPAGAAFRTDTFTLPAVVGGSPLPPQIAAVVAYRRDYGTDLEHGANASLPTDEAAIDEGAPATHTGATRPRARDRGRFYLGPLCTICLDPAGGGALVATPFKNDLTIGLQTLYGTYNGGAANQFAFVQWSRRAASVGNVSRFYINESFGVIRRRGDTTQSRVHNWQVV